MSGRGGPLIECFYPTSADVGVTLPRVRRFVIIVAVLLGRSTPSASRRSSSGTTTRCPRMRTRSSCSPARRTPSLRRRPSSTAVSRRTLVVSADRSGHDDETRRRCGKPPAGVVCIHAGPASTQGEAQAVGELVDRENWDSIDPRHPGLQHLPRRPYLPALRQREDHGARGRPAVVAERDRRAAASGSSSGLGDRPAQLLSGRGAAPEGAQYGLVVDKATLREKQD